MAWFPCKIGGGSSEIANILNGTDEPISELGENGQLYLQYGIANKYKQSQTLGGYVIKDYLVSNTDQFLCTIGGRGYNKSNDGDAIAVVWKHPDFSGPLLISTVPANVYYSYNSTEPYGSATIDGVTWYISSNGFWNNPVQFNGVPIFEASYLLDSSNIQTVIEDILEVSEFTVAPSTTVVKDTFAKVNGAWQDLMGTEIGEINAGGSKYIKATGSFTSGTASQQKVEVDCGFKPDLVMVDMEFGNGFTRATYLSTAWYEETDHPASVWDLRPMESVIYAITPESVEGETGITDLTDTGFKYRVNGGNTQGKACTYTAIKFNAEEVNDPFIFKNYAKFDGTGILLPYTINSDYKVTVEFYETEYDANSSVIGNNYSTGSYYSHLTKYNNNWYASQGTSDYLLTGWTGNVLHKFVNNDGNNQNVLDDNITMAYTPTTDNSIYYMIGCRESLTNWGYNGYIKSYKIESISTDNVICELKPCLYDNVTPCLYDTVNKKFYYADGLTVVDDAN